jgi:NTE family protein
MIKILISSFFLTMLVSGCASYGVVKNPPITTTNLAKSYSLSSWNNEQTQSSDIQITLAFSGGGTRAAALSYGVLQELRDTLVSIDEKPVRLLDEVVAITSVSGGSFTAAYYGLYGDRIFTDFEDVFLRRNVEKTLIYLALNPFRWFESTGRTDWAVNYYQESIFKGATYADMVTDNRPIIIINASDLGYGVRFSFLQEYFNLLCSDMSSFPIARAVAASSAVPIVFNPVVVENYADCGSTPPEWLTAFKKRAKGDPELTQTVSGLETLLDKDKRKYVHFVDGGITDNMGLRALLEIIETAGGIKAYNSKYHRIPPRHVVVIAVNASTDPEPTMDRSNKQPSLKETINAISDTQLHRYNVTTIESTKQSLELWGKELSTPARPVTTHFIQVDFRDVQTSEQRLFFNQIPTTFSLNGEQVDKLINAGRELLRNNPEFRRVLNDLNR